MSAGKTRKKLNTKGSRGTGGGLGDMLKSVYDPNNYGLPLAPSPITLTADAAKNLALSSLIPGTFYQITNDGSFNADYNQIWLQAIAKGAGAEWSPYGLAFSNIFSTWLPVKYNVNTFVFSGKVILWEGDLSQTGTNAPTLDAEHFTVFSSSPTFNYTGVGDYLIIFPESPFTIGNLIPTINPIVLTTGNASSVVYNASNKLQILTGRISGTLLNDVLNTSHFEIAITLS